MAIFDPMTYLKKDEYLGEVKSFKEISKEIMKYTWPAMVESFLVSLVLMIDGIMVSVLGNAANAAITVTKQPIFLMASFIVAVNIASIAIIARRYGASNRDGVKKGFISCLQINIIISLIVSTAFYFLSDKIIVLMGANSDTFDFANTYFKIMVIGFIFNALRLSVNSYLRVVGQTRASLYSNLVANLANVFLNYVLITGQLGFPALGIKGAAIATVAGNIIALTISLSYLVNRNAYIKIGLFSIFKFDSTTMQQIFKILPASIMEQAFIRFGFIVTAFLINNLGTTSQYVNGICNDIFSMGFTLADGFSIGISAIVGHKLGAKRTDLAYIYGRVGVTIGAVFAFGIGIIIALFSGTLIDLYSPATEEIKQMAVYVLLIASVVTVPQNVQWVLTGILRGAGDTKYTAKNSLISISVIRPITTYVLVYLTPLGLYGAWFAMLIDMMVRFTLTTARFRSKKWERIDI